MTRDPEPVPQDPERNHEGHQHDPSPPGSQKEMGREQTGDEQHPTGADPAALLGHLEHDPWACSQNTVRGAPWGSRHIENSRAAASRGCEHGSHFQPIHRGVRQRNHENQERDGKGRGGHPFRAEEQKPAGSDEAHKRESHQGQLIVDTQAPTPRDSCSQRREFDSAHRDRPGNRTAIRSRAAPPFDVKQVTADKRHQEDVRIQTRSGRRTPSAW